MLWRKLMDATVLDAGSSGSDSVHLYAHCLRGVNGGVALLAINTDAGAAHELAIPLQADRYTLTAKDAMDSRVDLNGSELKLTPGGDVPALRRYAGAVRSPDAAFGKYLVLRGATSQQRGLQVH